MFIKFGSCFHRKVLNKFASTFFLRTKTIFIVIVSGKAKVFKNREVWITLKAASQLRLSLYETVGTSFLFAGTYDLASGTMKFVQEQYIASAEYDLQLEFTPNTEGADGTCKQRIN